MKLHNQYRESQGKSLEEKLFCIVYFGPLFDVLATISRIRTILSDMFYYADGDEE